MPQEYGAHAYELLSDLQLSELVRGGNPQAFVELSSRYAGLIRKKAALFCGLSFPEPEDLLQEGFLGLYAAALGYREDGGGSFGAYAGACIYNQMVSAVRSSATAGNRTLNQALPLVEAGELTERAMGPQDLVETREQFDSMWRLELTPLERRVLNLYLSGCRRAEVQERSGISLKTFDNALYRIRSKLRRGREEDKAP